MKMKLLLAVALASLTLGGGLAQAQPADAGKITIAMEDDAAVQAAKKWYEFWKTPRWCRVRCDYHGNCRQECFYGS